MMSLAGQHKARCDDERLLQLRAQNGRGPVRSYRRHRPGRDDVYKVITTEFRTEVWK